MREIKKIRLALLTIMRAVFANYVRIMHVVYKVIYYIVDAQTLKIILKLIQIYSA